MRIGVVAPSAVPYVRGGYERLCTGLVDHFNENTEHEAELFKLPFPETNLHEVVDGYRRFSSLDDLGVDIVITGKYPAWCIDHPNHVVYMAHPLRGLYDTYPAGLGLTAHPDAEEDRKCFDRAGPGDRFEELFGRFDRLVSRLGSDHPAFAYPGPLARAVVHALDRVALAPARIRRYAAISATVASRPDYFPPGAKVAAAHTPSNLALTATNHARDGFFTASRLDQPKRLDVLIAAMGLVDADVKLRIAGDGPEAERLRAMAADDPRIEFLGFVGDDELASHYSRAIAVPFIPRSEDLGLIAMEAMGSGAPVVTTIDSGGPAELVIDGVNGLVVGPDPASLAGALDRLASSPDLVERLGDAGRRTAAGITWTSVADRLLGAIRPMRLAQGPIPPATGRPRLVVLSTYAIHPPRHGGQLRCRHLYGGLVGEFDVHALSLVEPDRPHRQLTVAPGFVEVQIPRTPEHSRIEWQRSGEVGIAMGDLYGGAHLDATPAYLDTLARAVRGAAAVLLAQPYMAPALAELDIELPVVYDAHNVEARLKSDVLPATIAGDAARRAVAAVEGAALTSADLLLVCSAADEREFRRLFNSVPPSQLVPNGVDVAATRFTPMTERLALRRRWLAAWNGHDGMPTTDRPVALFIGSWHPPNLEAARIIHAVADDRPEILFLMAGGHANAFAADSLPPNVVSVGEISDLTKATLLAMASVALNPMIAGSGTNLKLVEYLAAGIPAVSTFHGARGVAVDGDDVCVLSRPTELAASLEAVLTMPMSRAIEMTERGRRLAEGRFDWRRISRSLGRTLVDRLDIGRRPRIEGARRQVERLG